VTGGTAKKMSENFGKIMQDRQSLSINSSDVSVSKSSQLDYAIPAAKIAMLSSGEFVGIVSDNPEQKIDLKMFHSEIQNDHKAIAQQEFGFRPIPKVSHVEYGDVMENYIRIKHEVEQLVKVEAEKLRAKYGEMEVVLEKADGGVAGDEQAVVL
jgi:hypothetical protein